MILFFFSFLNNSCKNISGCLKSRCISKSEWDPLQFQTELKGMYLQFLPYIKNFKEINLLFDKKIKGCNSFQNCIDAQNIYFE